MAVPAAQAGGFGAVTGEGSVGIAGIYPKIVDNIFSMTPATSAAGYAVNWNNGYTPVSNVFQEVCNNDLYGITGSIYTSIYGPSSTTFSPTPPGAAGCVSGSGNADISVNPMWLGCAGALSPSIMNCNLKGWATSAGITWTTWADIQACFRNMNVAGNTCTPDSIGLEYNWVRAGFAPQNPAMHGTAYAAYTPVGGVSMQDIGPIPYQAAGNPFWAFPTP
jgi:hypothetical protein